MKQQLTRYTFIATLFFSLLNPTSIFGLGLTEFKDFFNDMKNATEENYAELEKKICDKGKLCRQVGGEICGISRNFFDLCWMICKDFKGFKDSKCMGKVKSKFNKETGTWNTRKFTVQSADNCEMVTVEKEETPAEHFIRQIFKQRKSDGMFTGVIDSFCSVIEGGNEFVINILVPEDELKNTKDGCSKDITCTD